MKTDKAAEIILYLVIGVCMLNTGKEAYRRISAKTEYDDLGNLIDKEICGKKFDNETDSALTLSVNMNKDPDINDFIEEEPFYDDIDLSSLSRINPEFVGILYIPELKIRYPVVQTTDNEKYLKKTFEGNDNPAGCIFMDCDNKSDLSDNITYIYGHNMKDGSMFGALKKLIKMDTTKKEIKAYIFTKDKKREYKYTGSRVADINEMKDIYSDGSAIILYTCWGNEKDKRLLTIFKEC